jgi:FKBP-type peptidyl-prolyl cis-trans isomerase FkpA
LQLIGKGGKIILWIPAELAYGASSPSPNISANEALKFVVELEDVIKPEVTEEAAAAAPATK